MLHLPIFSILLHHSSFIFTVSCSLEEGQRQIVWTISCFSSSRDKWITELRHSFQENTLCNCFDWTQGPRTFVEVITKSSFQAKKSLKLPSSMSFTIATCISCWQNLVSVSRHQAAFSSIHYISSCISCIFSAADINLQSRWPAVATKSRQHCLFERG